jgi:hypothetical protein
VLLAALLLAVVLVVAAPPALASSRLARHCALVLAVAMGAGLLAASGSGALTEGALGYVLPLQLLGFVVVPPLVAAAARSVRAGVQGIVWFGIFGAVVTFPVYIAEALRTHDDRPGLFLDGDLPALTSVGTNFDDAVAWLFVVGPGLLVPLGIVLTVPAATIARAYTRSRVRAD